jgi:hypothetical protein
MMNFVLMEYFVTNSFFEKPRLKGAKNLFWGKTSSHWSLLATILRIPWNNVTSEIEIYLGMFATLAPSRNWKKALLLLMWNNSLHTNTQISTQLCQTFIHFMLTIWYWCGITTQCKQLEILGKWRKSHFMKVIKVKLEWKTTLINIYWIQYYMS